MEDVVDGHGYAPINLIVHIYPSMSHFYCVVLQVPPRFKAPAAVAIGFFGTLGTQSLHAGS